MPPPATELTLAMRVKAVKLGIAHLELKTSQNEGSSDQDSPAEKQMKLVSASRPEKVCAQLSCN